MKTCNHHHHEDNRDKAMDRRDFLTIGAASVAGTASAGLVAKHANASDIAAYADPANPALPPSTMELERGRAALLVVDPQIDFLSPDGVTWGVVGESVTEHNVVENIGQLFRAAKAVDMPVVISPHYYYPHDHRWSFEGALEKVMHKIGMFDRPGPLDTEGIEGSGADFMAEYKGYIFDARTIIASPHKIYGPEQNDAGLQLRKLKVDQIILAGMSANLCVEAHMREFIEQGFEVAVVRDATAGAEVPEGDGYLAALINFRMMANALWTTDEAVDRMATLGAMKFTAYEASAIEGLVASSPLLSWLYAIFDQRGVSNLIGVVEITAASLLAFRPWSAVVGAIGAVLVTATTTVTLTFLFTAPGWEASLGGFPALSVVPGQFLVKDAVLLGAALWILGDTLREIRVPR